jgi:hypothetical protein
MKWPWNRDATVRPRQPVDPPRLGGDELNCWVCHTEGGTWQLPDDLGRRYWVWVPCQQCGGRGHVYFAEVQP